jgi:hypothetical protein
MSLRKTQENFLNYVLKNPSSKNIKILNFVLKKMIPFNGPHRFSITNLNPNEVNVKIPYKRINWNHLKGIHATCLATGGEYSAGLLLMQLFSPQKFRIIMSEIKCEYLYQAKKTCIAKATIKSNELSELEEDLNNQPSASIKIITEIFDIDEVKVCHVTTLWQVKKWDQVKTAINS